jgi:hypothetical protein
MDVYLVPIGIERYELYCEVPDDPTDAEPEQADGVVRRIVQRFRAMLSEAERQRRREATEIHGGWIVRARARMMRWVAESIAEQRLLWHLRRQTQARLFYPDDMEESRAVLLLRAQLRRDFDKHRFWLVIDSLGFIASGLLVLIPGPNLLAYYFAFRLVGHYFSMRGARQGLQAVRWANEHSAPLSDLRRAIGLEGEVRERRVHDVALRLRLEHLASFFERTVSPTS